MGLHITAIGAGIVHGTIADGTTLGITQAGDGVGTDLGTVEDGMPVVGTAVADGMETIITTIIRDLPTIIAELDVREEHIMVPDIHPTDVTTHTEEEVL